MGTRRLFCSATAFLSLFILSLGTHGFAVSEHVGTGVKEDHPHGEKPPVCDGNFRASFTLEGPSTTLKRGALSQARQTKKGDVVLRWDSTAEYVDNGVKKRGAYSWHLLGFFDRTGNEMPLLPESIVSAAALGITDPKAAPFYRITESGEWVPASERAPFFRVRGEDGYTVEMRDLNAPPEPVYIPPAVAPVPPPPSPPGPPTVPDTVLQEAYRRGFDEKKAAQEREDAARQEQARLRAATDEARRRANEINAPYTPPNGPPQIESMPPRRACGPNGCN